MEQERDQQVGVLSHKRDNTKRKDNRSDYKSEPPRPKIRTTNLIEGVINKELKQRYKVIGIFPNQKSCLRNVCMRLMENEEEWQTGRRYMKITKEDQNQEQNDPLLCEIKQIKEEVNS